MLQARGLGFGLLLTLAVLLVLVGVCALLLVPHLAIRGAGSLLGARRRQRLVPSPSQDRPVLAPPPLAS